MKTAAEWANTWTKNPEMVRLGQISLSIDAANLLVEVFAEAMAAARREALEEAIGIVLASGYITAEGHAAHIRALLDDAGRAT